MNANQSNIHILNANLGRWLGPQLPPPVVEAACEFLAQSQAARKLRGLWIRAFGDDLHLHLTTFNGDFAPDEDPNEFAAQLARAATLAALAKGFEMGLGLAANSANPLHLSGAAQGAALDLRRLDYPFTERRIKTLSGKVIEMRVADCI